MGQLERRVDAISGEFNSQDIANTMWAFTTMGTKPGERMMGQLERQLEAMSGKFNSQEVVNTMWAFATMGTNPGERMMGQLERRTETISGEFKSQDIANTMWASSFFLIHFNLSLRFCCSFSSRRLYFKDSDDHKNLCQLHQFFISCDMIEGLHVDLSVTYTP